MELLAEGRMAEVFALDEDRVLKLDRPEWNGVSEFERDVITRVAAAGLPVARAHGMMTVDGRSGVVLDRVSGRSLQDEIGLMEAEESVNESARRFAHLQQTINATRIDGLSELTTRMQDEIARSGLAPARMAELGALLRALDDGHRGICHFDFHPHNVIVGPQGWVVIDWLTAAAGPSLADLARTLVLRGREVDPPFGQFMREVRRSGLEERGADQGTCDAWVRVVAGARLAEGFAGAYAEWLRAVADGAIRLCV
jgi:Ser/Thr protein kinase RdoA (MazF antagonist)